MSTEYLDKNGLGQVWDKIKKKNVCVPDVNLILEYSSNESTGANREYGLGGLCYIGNNQYVFYVRNKDPNGNCGKLVCVDASTKKFLWRTNSIKGYHGNTLIHANNGIYMSAAENDDGDYLQRFIYFPLSGAVTNGVKAGSATETTKSGLGGNISYDRITGTYYSSVGRHLASGQRYGDIYKWSGIFNTKIEDDTINLVDANQGNDEIIDLIQNGWYQGCCIENGIFYQIYWREQSLIAAFDLKTGVHIKTWNIPNKSNYCKVMNEMQDITYNYDRDMFLFCSTTYTARIGQVPIVNISEVGLYKNLEINIPSRLQALVATSAAYENCFLAYIEMGANGFRTSGTDQQGNEYLTNSPLRDDCTPCCDRYDASGNVQYNRFRSIKDAEYAYECCTPGGGKIKFVFTNTFDSTFTVSSPSFLKPCIITGAAGKTMTLSGPFLAGCPNAYICGESSANPIIITGGGGSGYPEKNKTNGRDTSANPLSLILVGNGSHLALKNVKFSKNSDYTSILYGVYVYENGHLTVGDDVTLDTSVYTQTGCRVAYVEDSSAMLKKVTYTYSYSLNSSASLNVYASDLKTTSNVSMTDWPIANPQYVPVAATQVSSGNGNVMARTWNVMASGSSGSSAISVALRNVTTSTQTGTVTFVVLYANIGLLPT